MKFTIAILVVVACAILAPPLSSSLPATEKCSPILPAPTSYCSAGSISNSRRALLSSIARGNLTEFLDLMNEIIARARCHPAYLSINETEFRFNPDFESGTHTDLGKSAYYLKNCFLNNISNLADSESDHHINGEQIYFDVELRNAAQHVVSIATSLIELARSDPRLTEGSNCAAPPITCPSYQPSQTNLTPSQIRYLKLVVSADSLKRYAAKMDMSNYWTAVQ